SIHCGRRQRVHGFSRLRSPFALPSGPVCDKRSKFLVGRVAEWFKAPVLKTGVPARVPWVRIPPLPPKPLFMTVRPCSLPTRLLLISSIVFTLAPSGQVRHPSP